VPEQEPLMDSLDQDEAVVMRYTQLILVWLQHKTSIWCCLVRTPLSTAVYQLPCTKEWVHK